MDESTDEAAIGRELARVRIVLVGTVHSGNIGAAARAMKNMGLRRLYLAAPVEFPHREATYRAVQATDEPWHGRPASAVLVLPPLSALWLKPA